VVATFSFFSGGFMGFWLGFLIAAMAMMAKRSESRLPAQVAHKQN
jgi:hypothetical protein